ncbi:hypothetical protein [Spirochaeta thermophila]|nr:hypothetical protein [Spirochaeta thermophila]
MRYRDVVLSIGLGLVLMGCAQLWEGGWDGVVGGGGIEEREDLFVEGEDGWVVFETNDPDDWGSAGVTMWAGVGEEDPFEGWEVEVVKECGDGAAGYGVVFNEGEEGGDEVMYVVLITIEGEYIVGEVVDGVFEAFEGWKQSSAIERGYGQVNRLGVSRDGDGYVVRCNGADVTRMEDDEPPVRTGGRYGYIVVISPEDEFPEVGVRVKFREVK